MAVLTVAGCVILQAGNLLVLWKRNRQHFELPGGKIDPGETPEEAALRETREEIGCDAFIEKDLGTYDFFDQLKGFKVRNYRYLARLGEGCTPRVMEPDVFERVFWLPVRDHRKYALAPNVSQLCEELSVKHKM